MPASSGILLHKTIYVETFCLYFRCELARVTVIDPKLNVVLDRTIRPLNPVIDANTRFSGLTIDELEASKLQITDVQMELLHLWDEETILIGHSLESDLIALKVTSQGGMSQSHKHLFYQHFNRPIRRQPPPWYHLGQYLGLGWHHLFNTCPLT